MNHRFVLPLIGALFLGLSPAVLAQEEITLLAPGGAKPGIAALLPGFEAQAGVKVKATFVSGAQTRKLATDGTAFDVKVVQLPLADILAKGNVVVKSQTPLPGVQIGVLVKAGAPKPDISTAAAVKKMLLDAKSVTYPDPAGTTAAGPSFYNTLVKLGIVKKVQAKLKYASGDGEVVKNVVNGDAEIGIAFLGEAISDGGTAVGPLPADISTPTQLVGFVSANAKNPDKAAALLKYLTSPAAADIYRAYGMQP